jgi:integrative and conjugative element protein (TIGR02256 family)
VRAAVKLRLNVAPEARTNILRLAPESADECETGGILLGRGPSRHGLIDVLEAGDPGPKAERHADRFLRDLDHARALAERAWDRARALWVGEWHTHPKSGPEPSARDLVTYSEILADPDLGFDVFVSIIVTPDKEHAWALPRLTAWCIARGRTASELVIGRC